jgi:hypothetical protein
LEKFNFQDLSNTVWAFVIVSMPGSNSFMPHHLSMIVFLGVCNCRGIGPMSVPDHCCLYNFTRQPKHL